MLHNGERFRPAPDLELWLRETFINADGRLWNEEHAHLQAAVLGVLWTTEPNSRHMNQVVAQAEAPFFQGGRWAKARQAVQMDLWFGGTPDFLLTFDVTYAAESSDATWCALCEHELLHCGQALDIFGAPKFRRDGRPVFALRGHDVEEFVTVVRRYGAGNAAGKTSQLVAAAVAAPEFGVADISACCGTCQR